MIGNIVHLEYEIDGNNPLPDNKISKTFFVTEMFNCNKHGLLRCISGKNKILILPQKIFEDNTNFITLKYKADNMTEVGRSFNQLYNTVLYGDIVYDDYIVYLNFKGMGYERCENVITTNIIYYKKYKYKIYSCLAEHGITFDD